MESSLRQVKQFIKDHSLLKWLLAPLVWVHQSRIRRRHQAFDQAYRHYCGLVVEDPVIAIEEFQGQFQMDVRSDLFRRIFVAKEYEPKLVSVSHQYIDYNRDVIDVGANIGFYSVLFAQSIHPERRVLSVEPTVNALNRLKKNLARNKVDEKVIIYEGAASSSQSLVDIKYIEGKEEYSSLGNLNHPAVSHMHYATKTVPCTTIDHLVAEYHLDPGLIKIDVEGVEHHVFEGCRQILKNNRPIILSELSDDLLTKNGSSSDEVIRFIEQFRYKVIDPLSLKRKPGSKKFGDILCVPMEKL
jgi:FkbM family methyltransferase